VAKSPACPTIQGNRRYIITPRIVRIEGVKTPPNAPYFLALAMKVFTIRLFTIYHFADN
jgi:hypothetical protein